VTQHDPPPERQVLPAPLAQPEPLTHLADPVGVPGLFVDTAGCHEGLTQLTEALKYLSPIPIGPHEQHRASVRPGDASEGIGRVGCGQLRELVEEAVDPARIPHRPRRLRPVVVHAEDYGSASLNAEAPLAPVSVVTREPYDRPFKAGIRHSCCQGTGQTRRPRVVRRAFEEARHPRVLTASKLHSHTE